MVDVDGGVKNGNGIDISTSLSENISIEDNSILFKSLLDYKLDRF